MTIKISRQLTHEQYIKLFSNPISGIACEVDSYNRNHRVKLCCQNIRYSKSMLLGALRFWSDRIFNFYLKVTRINNPLEPMKDIGEDALKAVDFMDTTIKYVETFPDSFLFSHRYIMPYEKEMTDAMSLQLKLLNEKYQKLITGFRFQITKMDPFTYLQAPYGIQFTVFPNEHPYIKRQKIMEVGKTQKGNTFVIKG